MKILFSTRAFLPLLGGLELGTAQLAEELTRLGHEVVLLTTTPGEGPDRLPFRVVRLPGILETLRWMRWCDVVHQPNLSLKGIWPRLVVRRPWVVSHHSWYRRGDGRIAWQDRLNPIQQVIGCGCNLNRRIDRLIGQAGLEIVQLDRLVMEGVPRIAGELYRGIATPDRTGVNLQPETDGRGATRSSAPPR